VPVRRTADTVHTEAMPCALHGQGDGAIRHDAGPM